MASTLEKQFAREKKQKSRNNVKWAESERKRKKREDSARASKEGAELRDLLSVFRKKQPVKISGGGAEFAFQGRGYTVRYGKWTIGGKSSDPDDYVTNHEGWCLYIGRTRITDIFEIEYDSPKPTSKQFSESLVSILHEIEHDPGYFGCL